MAKIALSKLGLKNTNEVKVIKFNEQELEVKQYLPIEQKLQFIENVLNLSSVDMYFYNQGKIEIYFDIELIKNYTNINFTDKQNEEILKWYDKFSESGLLTEIKNAIPEKEIIFLKEVCEKQIQSVYHYRDSILGIMDNLKTDYSDMDLKIDKLTSELKDNKDIGFVKEVMEKLG